MPVARPLDSPCCTTSTWKLMRTGLPCHERKGQRLSQQASESLHNNPTPVHACRTLTCTGSCSLGTPAVRGTAEVAATQSKTRFQGCTSELPASLLPPGCLGHPDGPKLVLEAFVQLLLGLPSALTPELQLPEPRRPMQALLDCPPYLCSRSSRNPSSFRILGSWNVAFAAAVPGC